ncbi:MAG: biotin--[acetyl-CoA-carboxylase] ligase [Candidatus Thorarchaeota archaeon]|jgi:BirA family biotin operon repressor/biotin-[acetyl-CoA-carboxylase] ligase
MLDQNEILRCAETKILAPRLIVLDEVGSTNAVAKKHVLEGEGEGLVVVADNQTEGRGRHDRVWISPKGSLYLSIVLEPRVDDSLSPLLALLMGCASASAIMKLGVIPVRLKWPNDILVGKKKIGGILSELVTDNEHVKGVIVGVGINQNVERKVFPEEIRNGMTTIYEEICSNTSREHLASRIVGEIDRRLITIQATQSFAPVLIEYKGLCDTLGKKVRVDQGTDIIEGKAVEIDENGSLIVMTDAGKEAVTLGDVVHLE